MYTHTLRINRLSQLVRFLSVLRLFLWTMRLMYRERRWAIGAYLRGAGSGGMRPSTFWPSFLAMPAASSAPWKTFMIVCSPLLSRS